MGLKVGTDFVETGDGLVPVALQVQMVFQPADELHGPLGKPLDGEMDDPHFRVLIDHPPHADSLAGDDHFVGGDWRRRSSKIGE